MALPTINTAIFDLKVPGKYGVSYKYRPFKNKEYKALLKAREFGDDASFAHTIRGVLSACLLGKVDVDTLPVYLIDYIFLKIRIKSVGDIVDAKYSCNNMVEKSVDGKTETVPCGETFNVQINLDRAKIIFPEDFNMRSVVKLTDTVGMKLRNPTFHELSAIQSTSEGKQVLDISEEYIYSCIESIYDGDKVLIPEKDFKLDDVKVWLDQFVPDQILQVSNFFSNQPVIGLDLNIKCPSCGTKHSLELRGLNDFFE